MKRSKIKFWIMGVVLIAALGIGIYASGKGVGKETEYLSASWAYNYRDIEEISQASDLIALVRVTGVKSTVIENDIPFTIFSVDVITPVYNTAENDSFTIYMTGGETKEKIVEIIDDPLLQTGDEILVFCKLNPDGTYRIISGSQGRLIYANGKLSSLNSVNPRVAEANSFSSIRVDNVDAVVLIDEIKGYIEAKD